MLKQQLTKLALASMMLFGSTAAFACNDNQARWALNNALSQYGYQNDASSHSVRVVPVRASLPNNEGWERTEVFTLTANSTKVPLQAEMAGYLMLDAYCNTVQFVIAPTQPL